MRDVMHSGGFGATTLQGEKQCRIYEELVICELIWCKREAAAGSVFKYAMSDDCNQIIAHVSDGYGTNCV